MEDKVNFEPYAYINASVHYTLCQLKVTLIKYEGLKRERIHIMERTRMQDKQQRHNFSDKLEKGKD